MNASEIGLLLSYLMALYLFSIAFIEGIKISNPNNKKVNGSTLIMSLLFALFFTRMATLFYSYQ